MITYKEIEMNLVRPIAELHDRADSANDTPSRLPMPSIARQRYCITTLCNNDHGDAVEHLMRRELRTPAICIDQIVLESQLSRHLVRVVAVVTCTARGRADLFRLVNRLGFDAGVRSIRWETKPFTPPCIAAQRFDALVPHTDSATARAPNRVASACQ